MNNPFTRLRNYAISHEAEIEQRVVDYFEIGLYILAAGGFLVLVWFLWSILGHRVTFQI